jgi:hypothetical protein
MQKTLQRPRGIRPPVKVQRSIGGLASWHSNHFLPWIKGKPKLSQKMLNLDKNLSLYLPAVIASIFYFILSTTKIESSYHFKNCLAELVHNIPISAND